MDVRCKHGYVVDEDGDCICHVCKEAIARVTARATALMQAWEADTENPRPSWAAAYEKALKGEPAHADAVAKIREAK